MRSSSNRGAPFGLSLALGVLPGIGHGVHGIDKGPKPRQDNICPIGAMLHDGVIQWSGPVSKLDSSGDPYLDQFVHGRAEGPIEAVR